MLDNGIVWIESYEGKITAEFIWHLWKKVTKKRLIAKERKLACFIKTLIAQIQIKNAKHLGVDEPLIPNTKICSWKNKQNRIFKPDIILNNGALGIWRKYGNHVIVSNGSYTYKVSSGEILLSVWYYIWSWKDGK
jgi:hypothetical protein